MKLILSSILTILMIQATVAEELPSDFKKCKVQDSTCLKDAVNDALPKLAGGIKGLGVPPLDPLHMDKFSVNSGKIVQLVQNYGKTNVIGFSTVKVSDIRIDLDKGKITIDTSFAKLDIKGLYTVRGKILVLDVYGTGDFLIRLENAKSKILMDIQKYEKNGETYIKVTKFSMDVEPALVNYRFDNLFDGNKQLGDNINNVLNDNWKEIYEELKQGYFEKISIALMKYSNKLFEKIPLKYLFPSG